MAKIDEIIDTKFDPQIEGLPNARIHYIHFRDPSKAVYALVFPKGLTKTICTLYKNTLKFKKYLMENGIFLKNMEEFGEVIKTSAISTSNVSVISKYLMKNGLYYLIEEENNSKNLISLYVGKTEDGVKRFIDHEQKKNWWTKVVLFFSNSDFGPLVCPLERYAIEHGKATRQVFRNRNNSNADNSDEIVFFLEKTYDDICSIMDFLHYSLSEEDSDRYHFHFRSDNFVKVDMLYTQCGKYVLLPGSEIDLNKHASKKEKERIADLNMIDDNGKPLVLDKKKDSDNIYQLLVPKFFETPTAAAEYARGLNTNGRNDDGSSPIWVNNRNPSEPLRDVIPE